MSIYFDVLVDKAVDLLQCAGLVIMERVKVKITVKLLFYRL